MKGRWLKAAGATLAVSLLLVNGAGAQEKVKIGFVDLLRALNESEAGLKAQGELKQIVDEKKATLQRDKDAIAEKKEELDKQGLLLNEQTRRNREDEIRRLERDHTRALSDIKEEINRLETKYTEAIRKDLMQVIEEIGREEGYTLILEKQYSAILYAPNSISLTDTVIKRYDAPQSE